MSKKKKREKLFRKIDILLIVLVTITGIAVLLFAAGATLTVLMA